MFLRYLYSDGQMSNPNLTVKSPILCFQIPIPIIQIPNPNPKSQSQNSKSESNLKSQSFFKTIKQYDCVKYRMPLANVTALFSNEFYCQLVPKLPLNAKFEKVGSENCQLATLPKSWLNTWMKQINTDIDRWFGCQISKLKSNLKKSRNQIESQSSVWRIKSLNCRITPKNFPNRDLNPNRDWDLPITVPVTSWLLTSYYPTLHTYKLCY